ncbi:uncharacterized protein [Amphiura filiformis]|uniref:uncharacterized protein n=1 Tax=Amphiura filiformis TaxID=82378 RepID=UPI003B21E11B
MDQSKTQELDTPEHGVIKEGSVHVTLDEKSKASTGDAQGNKNNGTAVEMQDAADDSVAENQKDEENDTEESKQSHDLSVDTGKSHDLSGDTGDLAFDLSRESYDLTLEKHGREDASGTGAIHDRAHDRLEEEQMNTILDQGEETYFETSEQKVDAEDNIVERQIMINDATEKKVNKDVVDIGKIEDEEADDETCDTQENNNKKTNKRKSRRQTPSRHTLLFRPPEKTKPELKKSRKAKSVVNVRYVCRYCRKTYSTPGSVKDHLYIHAGKKRYQCQFCGETFMHRKERNTHIIVDHDQDQTELKYDSEMQYPSKETVWHCDECDLIFKTLKRLRDHLAQEHPDMICNRFEASLDSALEDTGEKEVVPPKRTPKKQPKVLQQKIKVEQEEIKENPILWRCNLCTNQRQFLSARELRKHMTRAHVHAVGEQLTANFGILSMELGNLSLSCGKTLDLLEKMMTLCQKESSKEGASTRGYDADYGVQLGNSMDVDEDDGCQDDDDDDDNDNDDDDEDYVSVAFEKRVRPPNLTTNQKNSNKKSVHIGKKKYKGTGIRYRCSYCKKTFGRVSTLRDHLYLHSGEKRFKCPHCELYLMNRGAVHHHVKNEHQGMPFDDAEFSQRQRPSQEVVWQCDVCDSTSEKLYQLKSHVKVEHKRVDCDVFEAKFRTQLKRDMKLLPLKWRAEVMDSELVTNNENKGYHSNDRDKVCGDESGDSNDTIDVSLKAIDEVVENEKTECDRNAGSSIDLIDEESEACLTKMYKRKVGFRCRYCQKIYTTVSSVRDHLYVHTDEKRYKCLYCDIPIKARGSLSNHMRQYHADAPPILETSQKEKQKPAKEMVWVCTYCAKSFPTLARVRVHTLEQHGVSRCSIFEVSFSDEYENKVSWCVPSVPKRVAQELVKKVDDNNWTYKMPDDCDYICKYCDHISARVSTLKDHLCSLHAENPSYKCFYCDQLFKNRAMRSNHCRDIHPKEVRHKKNLGKESWQILPSQMLVWECMECKQMFNVVNRLRYHMKESHNSADCKTFTAGLKEREDLTSGNLAPSFDCKFCGKSYDCPSKVQRHETTLHRLKIPRYRCDICGKTFQTDKSLLTHKNKFHADWVSDEKPDPSALTDMRIQHLCKYCGKVFDRKCTLTFHEKVHSQGRKFHCNQCPRRFLSQHVLSKHQKRVHINPPAKPKKDHLCQYCGKSFTQQKVLDSHVNIHLGIRPFQCKACHHTFPSRRRLSKHIWATKCKQMLGNRDKKVLQHKNDGQNPSGSSSKKHKNISAPTASAPDRPEGLIELPSQQRRDHEQDDHSLSHAISMANNVIDQSPPVHVDFRQAWAVPEHHQLASVYMPVTQWRN